MINNLNNMKIKKFNENISVEEYDIFQNEEKQSIIKKDLLEDYFSIFENDYDVLIKMSVINDSGQNCFYLDNDIRDNTLYMGEISYNVVMCPKNIDRTYAIDHGDYVVELLDVEQLLIFNKYMDNIKSIKNKLYSINHDILIGFEGVTITCIIRNKENNKF